MKILSNLFNNKVKTENVQGNKVGGVNENEKKTSSIFEQLNIEKTPENEKIVQTLEKNNVTPTKEIMKEVTNFINTSEGSFDSKLETINSLAEKGIELTEENLTAVHEAVNGEFTEPETLIGKFIDSDAKAVMKQLKKMGVKPEMLKNLEDLVKAGTLTKEDLAKFVSFLVFAEGDDGAALSYMISKFSDDVKSIWSGLGSALAVETSTGDLSEVLFSQVDTKENTELNEKFDAEKPIKTDDKVEEKKSTETVPKAENHEVKINVEVEKEGYEQVDTKEELEEVLQEFLTRVEESVSDVVTYEALSMLAQGHQFESKSFLVKEITEKMLDLKKDFSDFKKSINENLSKVINDMEVEKKVSVDTKELISKTIEKTDSLLMKSDIPLFTSIKTEKQLLLLSSDLEEARSLLEDGKYKESLEVLKKVSGDINKLLFDPSAKKVIAQTSELIVNSPSVILNTGEQISPRNVLETLRNLGVNHESEIAEKAFATKEGMKDKINENAKAILLKLVNENSTEHKVDALADKNLSNLLGQQFMNKLEPNSGMQKMLFNIPIKTDEEIKNLKVHINGKKKNEKMDWKNSSMYFLIKLDNYGETGIKVDSVDAHVKITVKNDEFETMKDREDVVGKMSEKLEEIGFKIDSISFTTLTEKKPVEAEEIKGNMSSKNQKTTSVKEEGFDFKI